MRYPLLWLSGCWLAAPLSAQSLHATVPAVCAHLPGNAAVSMPLRWSQGAMQVLVNRVLLPGDIGGRSITALRLRRPALLDEPAYAAMTTTLTITAGFTTNQSWQMSWDLAVNRAAVTDPATGSGLTTVFGPAAVSVAATAANGPGDALGAEFLVLTFATPLPVPTDALLGTASLFLEFAATGPTLGVDAGNWVDALLMQGGSTQGLAVSLGNHGCGAGTAMPTLQWSGAGPPQRGVDAALRVTNAGANAPTIVLLGFAPETHAVNATLGLGYYLGLGGALDALGAAGCYQWSPLDLYWLGSTDVGGAESVTFPLPAAATAVGQRLSVQVGVFNAAANPLGFLFTNGETLVLDDAGVGGQCSTVFVLGPVTPTTTSPWSTYYGLMPVLGIDY
jgi:hypothetical protein